jgi:Xaa-Pro aminopeptidase
MRVPPQDRMMDNDARASANPMPPIHARRRERLAAALREAGGGLAIVANAAVRRRNGDNEYPYRSCSHFHYLTGFGETDAWLIVDTTGHSTIFCRPKDEQRELWDGARLGLDAAPAKLGVDAAYPVADLDAHVAERVARDGIVWTVFGGDEPLAQRVERWFASAREHVSRSIDAPHMHRDLAALLGEMRLVKDDHELATMRRAAALAAQAHRRAMQACRPGLREFELEAELLYVFRRGGASGPAYTPIVAAGANACVLHHPAGDAELQAGELCLVDAGCEVDGYASDITRTFPVDGHFTAAQRELYDLVLAAQRAAIEQVRPGARKQDAHWAAVRVLSQGLLDLRLLDADRNGALDDIVEKAAYRRFFMHGTGHWLGLDVHDAGEYLSLDEEPVEQPDGQGGRVVRRPSRRLVPGMVVTVEPGLYVRPSADVPERWWNIGIRIEDDAIVTADGCELISRDVPVQADEIEALMRS